MRTSEGPLPEFARVEPRRACRRNGGNFQRLGLSQRRKKTRQPLREHAFSGSWRAYHQQAMFSGSRNDECLLRYQLPAHVAQVQATPGSRLISIPRRGILRAGF